MNVLGKKVEYAIASDDGTLNLKFADVTLLTVSPNPHFEACGASATNGFRLVCLPGGGLATWKPE